MANVYAANVTKYNAGGSGDNIIADGYIKTVEKVWLDSWTFTATTSNATIDIAMIPPNKKITSIEVIIESTTNMSGGTIAIGDGADNDRFMAATTFTANTTVCTIRLPGVGMLGYYSTDRGYPLLNGFQNVTAGTSGTIQVTIASFCGSTGTMKSIVRYT